VGDLDVERVSDFFPQVIEQICFHIWPDFDNLRAEIGWESDCAEAIRIRSEQRPIPGPQRTRPLAMAEAARLMGYSGNSKQRVKQLRQAMNAGLVRFEKLTRQAYVFDRRRFPAESRAKLTPTRPN
jgi:hypothetical protein